MTRPSSKVFCAAILLAGAAALPALAQESLLPPGFGNDQAPLPPPVSAPPQSSSPAPSRPSGPGEGLVVETTLTEAELPEPPKPIEMPDGAKRDPALVGVLDPVRLGIGTDPWGQASGRFLSVVLRRLDSPLPSRWMHIALRNALLAETAAPYGVNPVEWVAERAWLLLRMGEADAARMLVAGVDVENFTPKMYQVAVQSALATADPSALCPLRDGIDRVEQRIAPLTEAICASLSGEPERASADLEQIRRRGRIGGADLQVAEKVTGVGGEARRAIAIEWDSVDRLTAWRFGMATATGVVPPDSLLASARPQLRAWQARAPLLSAEQRLPSARIAAGLGVFSSQALVDLYSAIYDATDPDDLGGTDAWQLRTAFVGRDSETKLAAMRHFWTREGNELERMASRASLALAATQVAPSEELAADAPELIASMLAGGYDRHAARWAPVVRGLDDEPGYRAWAMLALAAPAQRVDAARVADFVDADSSEGNQRSALLLAGLVGLGRIDAGEAARLAASNQIALNANTHWTRLIDGAAQRGQAGTVVILAAAGLQASGFAALRAPYLLHAVAALRRTGQDYAARMIAAEALART